MGKGIKHILMLVLGIILLSSIALAVCNPIGSYVVGLPVGGYMEALGVCSPTVSALIINPCMNNMQLDTDLDIRLWTTACADGVSGYTMQIYTFWSPERGLGLQWVPEPIIDLRSSIQGQIVQECGDNELCLRTGYKQICDNVSARIQLYYGDTNEQDTGWTEYRVPTDEFFWDSDNFKVNKTGTYQMKVWITSTGVGETWYYGDQETTTEMYTKIVNFTVVSTDGDEYGTCVTTDFADLEKINYGIEGIRDVFDGFGNTWVSNTLYLLFMIGIAFAMLMTLGRGRSFDYKQGAGWLYGIIFFVEGLLTLIGTWIGALSPVWLVLFGIVVIIPISMKIVEMIKGGR